MSSTTYNKWKNMWPVYRRAFFLQNEKILSQSPMGRLFGMATSEGTSEEFDGVGGLGLMDTYNGSIEHATFGKYPKTTIEFPEYAKGIVVPRKLIDDDKTGAIQRQFNSLGQMAARTKDFHAGSVFNNAFSSSYLGADGKALCATDHPLSSDNPTTQSNKGTSALTHSAVVTTIEAMQGFTDDTGELLGVDPNILLVPRGLAEEAHVIVNSIQKSGTSDNDANYVNSRPITIVVWHRLTDQNNWWMLDSDESLLHLHWIDRIAAEVAYSPMNEYDVEQKARVYARWGYGWDYPFFIYGHEVA